MTLLGLLLPLALAPQPVPWHHNLCLANGGLWRQRIEITITNAGAHDALGSPVSVRIGKGTGEAALAGTDARAVRVCNARGEEMLYDLAGPDGTPLRAGPIPTGSRLVLPAECRARSHAICFAYFDNPRAWQVPDYLEGSGALRNGGMESGEGDAPDGWSHDAPDPTHRAIWTAETSHTGRKCLKTIVAAGAEPTWISTRQTGLRIVGGARYRMTAWVRARDVVGDAGWYIHVGDAGSAMLNSPMLIAGSGTFDWKEVTAEFEAPAEADRADLGTVLRGTGTAWFDDVSLERLDGQEVLTAHASVPERLRVVVESEPASWWHPTEQSVAHWRWRAPVRTLNLGDTSVAGGLVSADLSTIPGRLQGRFAPEAIRVVYRGRIVPHYRMGDLLLFPAETPARTVRTFEVYLSDISGKPNLFGRGRAPQAYAPNPALPGGATTYGAGMALSRYVELLKSRRNLARNGSFETGSSEPAAWTGGAEGERPAGTEMGVVPGGLFGKRCGRIQVPAGSRPAWVGWRQDVPVKPGRTYLYSAWVKCADLVGSLQIYAHLLTESGALVKQNAMTGAGPGISGTQGWTLISGLFTTPDDCRIFQMHLTMLATGTAWHDGALLVEVTPGEVGGLESSAVSVPIGVVAWPVNAIVKVFRDSAPPAPVPAARISCARNESEPLQIAIRSSRAIAGVRVSVEPPMNRQGAKLADCQIGAVGYVPIDHQTNYYSSTTPAYYRKIPTGPGGSDGWPGWWPDPLIPRATFDLRAGETQPVWITVHVPGTAAPGDYRGVVRFLAAGRAIASVPFTVHVWAFAIPETRSLKAIFDTRQSDPMWRLPGKTEQETREAFWRFEAEHRVCPDRVQPDPTFTYRDGKATADFTEYDRAAHLYFDVLKFPHSYTPNQFYAFGWGHLPSDAFGEKPYEGDYPFAGVDRSKLRPEYRRAYQACLKLFWDHVKEKGWANRITLYISDEPYDGEAPIRAQMKALCDMVHEVDPAIPIYSSTWHDQPEWHGYLNVWGFGHYGIVPAKTMDEVKAEGATLWWTTDGQMCTDTPYCAIERLLPYYCFRFGAKAYEFWGIDWLTYDPYRFGWHRFLLQDSGPGHPLEWVRYPNGDGFLAYPPGPLKLDRAASSIRLEQVREGMEDYEYLHLLQMLIQKASAAGRNVAAAQKALDEAKALAVFPCEIGRYSTRILPDPDRVFRVRESVARAIEGLT